MKINVSPRTLRRLTAAEGYLDLNMPQHALNELESIEDPGPLEAVIEFAKGEVLKRQQRYDEAVVPLKRAAELVPAPHNRKAWLSLSECFRQGGREELAEMAELLAKSQTQTILQLPSHLELKITIKHVNRQDAEEEPGEELPPDEETDPFDEHNFDYN